MSDQKPPEKLLSDVEKFDQKELKHVDDKGVTPSQSRDMTMAGTVNITHMQKLNEFYDTLAVRMPNLQGRVPWMFCLCQCKE